MNKTLKISFSLKNTYRVNGILFSLKQIPLLKRLLPATLYQVKGLKIFANILSVLWEIVSTFIGKFLYFITMVCGIGILYKGLPENVVCFALMRLRMPIMIFGIMTIVFCALYSVVASILVYRLAPKTFRLRT